MEAGGSPGYVGNWGKASRLRALGGAPQPGRSVTAPRRWSTIRGGGQAAAKGRTPAPKAPGAHGTMLSLPVLVPPEGHQRNMVEWPSKRGLIHLPLLKVRSDCPAGYGDTPYGLLNSGALAGFPWVSAVLPKEERDGSHRQFSRWLLVPLGSWQIM